MSTALHWKGISLEQVIQIASSSVAFANSANIRRRSNQLFAALFQRHWPGSFVEVEIVCARNDFRLQFFRWQGHTLNIKGETIEQTLIELEKNDQVERMGMQRVFISPTVDVVASIQSADAPFDRLCKALDHLLLNGNTIAAKADNAARRL